MVVQRGREGNDILLSKDDFGDKLWRARQGDGKARKEIIQKEEVT